MKVIPVVEDSFWLDVAGRSPHATFFHTPYWRDLALHCTPGYTDASIGAKLSDGTRVVLPLLETGRSAKGLFRRLLSTFGGCYGGLIAETALPAARAAEVYRALLRRLRVDSLQLTGNPLDHAEGLPVGFEATAYSTHLLPLEPEWERVRERFSRGNRASINRGRRAGVTTRVASCLEEYRAYFSVYEQSLQRWGAEATSRYPWALFEAGHDLGRRLAQHMRLWIAESDGRVVAGAWVFYWNRHAVYWHGATDVSFSASRPSNVLHADIIKDACERGYRCYDFNPSGGHEGVARFKRSFGSVVHPIQVWRYRSRPAEIFASVRSLLP